MALPHPLSIDEARRVAVSIFGWFGFLLAASVGLAYSLLFRSTSYAEKGQLLGARVNIRSQLWVWATGGFFVWIAIASVDDVFLLAVTFPVWGILALGMYLWPIWFVGRWLSLNVEDVAGYSIVADDRSASKGKAISCDEQWLKSRSGTHDWRSRNECATIRVKIPPDKEDSNDRKDQIDSMRILL